jgi:hypothetical protein
MTDDEALDVIARRYFRPPRRVARGEGHANAKLTEAQVREVRRRAAAGEDAEKLARETGVHPWTIRLVISRKTWKHV